jgi:GH15 family glucan-1,4-alpha-glucosidase
VRRIGDHAVIGDGRSAALVTREGAIDWLCWPRFDSPSVFASLLDRERGGEWRISVPGARVTRAYIGATNVLVTRFADEAGEIELIDFMPVATREEHRRQLTPEHEIVRIVRCTRGTATVEVTFDPRPAYGRADPALRRDALGGWAFDHRGRRFLLRSTLDVRPVGQGLAGRATLSAGESRYLSFSAHREIAVLPPLGAWTEERLLQTIRYWRGWAARSTYDGPHREHVLRSALTLKLLCYAPSGAIVAAPTTSLPEEPGGSSNWDYRYCWLRDSAFTVRALLGVGHHEEARAFASWLLHATRLTRPELSVLYDVFGRSTVRERALPHLSGWADSKPVRIGNAADRQLQLDAYGELVDAVSLVYGDDEQLDVETSGMLRDLGLFVCENWMRRDRGIWEIRGRPQAFTHSRVMSWVALDRLIAMQRRGTLRRPVPAEWFAEVREQVRRDVERHAWNARIRSYTQTLRGSTIDASALLLGWYGFHEPDHPRMLATLDRVAERLAAGPGLIYRYEESRRSGEGAFAACSFWLAEQLAAAGRTGEASRLFRTLLGYANDVGLYAEEIDPVDGSALGNFPQAYTHVGLVSAALALQERPATAQREAR